MSSLYLLECPFVVCVLCVHVYGLWRGWVDVFIWTLWVPISLTHPRGPGCPGITTLCLFPTYSVVLSVSLPPAIERQGPTDFNCAVSFSSDTAGESPHLYKHKPCSVFLLWTRGHRGYKREKEKHREGGGELLYPSLWINGRKSGTINPPLSLCTVEYRIWWRQSAR